MSKTLRNMARIKDRAHEVVRSFATPAPVWAAIRLPVAWQSAYIPADSAPRYAIMSLPPSDQAKRAAAARALEMVEDGMMLGLGTGATAGWFVRLLSERIRREGLTVEGVATSSATVWLAEELGVPLRRLDDVAMIDLVVDGADEIDAKLNLIKGGGAALLQEKIVAAASTRMVVIADDSKRVARLGAFPLPVEIVRFGWTATRRLVAELLASMDVEGHEARVRMGKDGPLVTDEGNYILDLHLGRIGDAPALATALNTLPGVVEHGLFIDMAHCAVIGHPDGAADVLYRPGARGADPLDIAELMRNQDA
jgi:ribose 5-phosphate isomerase A